MRTCDKLTDAELHEQDRLYHLTFRVDGAHEDVGALLYCNIHRRPLIICHDEQLEISRRTPAPQGSPRTGS